MSKVEAWSNTAPTRIWDSLTHCAGGQIICYAEKCNDDEIEYIRADLADAIVQAALERAADFHDQTFTNPKAKKAYWQSDLIRALANDPAEVAAIISAAAQLNKAGDGNKEQRDEEDRG